METKEYNDNELQFIFNESIINKNFETILDILGEKLKTKKQIKNNKEKIISLLQETYPEITADKLSEGFNLVYEAIKDIPFKTNTIKELNESLNKYSLFILKVNNQFKDHGYSMLICGYFWLTRDY